MKRIDAVAFALLLAYFLIKPDIEDALIPFFFIFWVFAYSLDVLSTIRHDAIRYETNRLFAYIADRLGILAAIVIHLLTELAFISFIPFVFLRSLNIEASAITACITGLLHIYASFSNMRYHMH